MTGLSKLAILGIGALGLGGATLAFASSGASQLQGTNCAIVTGTSGGMTEISAIISSDTLVSGSYEFAVSGPAANIRQAGGFTAEPGRDTVLGHLSLGGKAQAYDMTFQIEVDGRTYDCARTI